MRGTVFLLGSQGAGKGTLGRILARELGTSHLSAGSLLRAHVRSGGRWADEIRRRIDRGEAVSEEISYGLLAEAVDSHGRDSGALLDGYPRHVDQLALLRRTLGCDPRRVLLLNVPRPVAVERLLSRTTCDDCDATYGPAVPSRRAGICDECGGRLNRREDDSMASIARRLDGWGAHRDSLVAHFERQDTLRAIDASRPIAEVREQAFVAIDDLRN